MGIRGREGRARAEAQALLHYAGLVLYKGDKDINDVARSPEGGPAEAGVFWSQVCLCWTEPTSVKANNIFILSASFIFFRAHLI